MFQHTDELWWRVEDGGWGRGEKTDLSEGEELLMELLLLSSSFYRFVRAEAPPGSPFIPREVRVRDVPFPDRTRTTDSATPHKPTCVRVRMATRRLLARTDSWDWLGRQRPPALAARYSNVFCLAVVSDMCVY